MGNKDIRVVAVHDDARMQEFLKLPWKFQENDPCWVAPILSEQKHFLDREKGPFFEIGEAEYFLAYLDGEPAGRISAHVNHAYEARHDNETGFFGFFECVHDQEVASALFDTAAEWVRKKGKSRLQGPMNFAIYDEIGLLIEGYDSLPALLQIHNPPYYVELVEGWGFRKAIDWYALRVTDRTQGLEGMEQHLQEIMRRQNLTLTAPNPKTMLDRTEEVFQLFNEAWEANWGHVPLTRKQFTDIFKIVKPLLRSDLITMILDGDDVAAFIINIPDLNPSIQKLNGKLSLLSKVKLYYEARFKPLHRIRTLLLGVKRVYQRRRLHEALIIATFLAVNKHHKELNYCDCSLIPETLHHYIKSLETFGARRYKTWRIYERDI
jgi:hypothetical protein